MKDKKLIIADTIFYTKKVVVLVLRTIEFGKNLERT